jgi:hypothetical protein
MPVSFALDAPPSSSACATTSLPAKSDASAPPAADGLLLSRGPSHDHFFAPWRAPLSRLNLKGRRDMPSDNLLAHNANTTKRPRPKLILPIGSGRTGKSLWSRWFIDRAAGHRSQLDIIDGDTLNPCLASFYKSARVPPAFKGDQPTWFEKTIESGVEGRRSTLLELGSWLFDGWLAELPLAESLAEQRVDLIAVYLLTPDVYSLPRLPYMLDLIKSPRTLIVLNEWGFDSDKARAAFSPILANPIVAAAQADGARIVTMPHLEDAEVLDAMRALRREGASGAVADPALSAWLTRMEENFAPVADWLA